MVVGLWYNFFPHPILTHVRHTNCFTVLAQKAKKCNDLTLCVLIVIQFKHFLIAKLKTLNCHVQDSTFSEWKHFCDALLHKVCTFNFIVLLSPAYICWAYSLCCCSIFLFYYLWVMNSVCCFPHEVQVIRRVQLIMEWCDAWKWQNQDYSGRHLASQLHRLCSHTPAAACNLGQAHHHHTGDALFMTPCC